MNSCVVGVDVGRTGCRIVVCGGADFEYVGHGVLPRTGRNGPRLAAAALKHAISEALTRAGLDLDAPTDIAVGMAGVSMLEGGSDALAEALAHAWPGTGIAVTGDVVSAHAGALDGEAGVVLAVGTGTIALGLSEVGAMHRVDGWGQWLGDDGSGAWIGREALQAVVRAADGRGDATALTDLAARRFGDVAGLPAQLPFESALPARTAAFAPDVVDAAAGGDTIAGEIIQRAADAWVDASRAAIRAVDATTVACVGGLAGVPMLYDAWAQAIEPQTKVVTSAARSVDGAVLLAERTDLPHETQVRRALVRTAPRRSDEDLDVLETEGVRDGLDDLDMRSAGEVVDALLDAEGKLPYVLDGARDGLVDAVSAVEAAMRRGGRLLYVGAGTPGRLAALDAAECPPTFGTPAGLIEAILAGGNDASAAAVEGAEDMSSEAVKALEERDVGSDDVVVGISASGRTPFVLAAIDRAQQLGAATVAIVNNPDSVIAEAADVAVELLTGAEVISGSTRMTAGTSQKVALNALSTATMVRLGKTYGPRMVDVVASNHKLRRRASRIVREVCGVDDTTAVETLEAAGWQAKTAIVSLLGDVDVVEARARLGAADGWVRVAVEGRT